MLDISTIPGAIPANTGTLNPISTLGSFGRGVVSMLPGGNQAYAGIAGAIQNEPYTQERQETNAEEQQDVEQNPVATYAGKAAGVIAPAISTGGLSVPESAAGAVAEGATDAVAPTALQSLGKATLQGAGIGGLFGAGNAVDTTANGGGPGQALGQVAVGAGLGGLGGAAAEGLSNAVGNGASALSNSSIGKKVQVASFIKALGLNNGGVARLAKAAGTNEEDVIADFLATSRETPYLPDNFYRLKSTVNLKQGQISQGGEQAGTTLGVGKNLYGQATAGNFPEGNQAIDDLGKAISGYQGIDIGGDADKLKEVQAGLQALQNKGQLDFDTMSQLKTSIGRLVPREVPGASQAYHILSSNLDDAMYRVPAPEGIDPQTFNDAKKFYSFASKITPLMMRGGAREAAQGGGGLANLTGMVGLALGHPAALAPAALQAVEKIAAPQAVSNMVLGGVPSVGVNAAMIGGQLANPEVNKQKTVYDYLMQSNSPAYAAHKANLNP